MSFVLDCSVTMAWCFEDERTAETDTLLDKLVAEGAEAPSIWPLEVSNVLIGASRRNRISPAEANVAAQRIAALPVLIDLEGSRRAWDSLLQLAVRYGLTSYDTCYLELALRKALPLATLDKALQRAATEAGVVVL